MLHIDIPTVAEFRDLAQLRAQFCVSLYMPTSRLGEKAKANRTLFKDLAKQALAQLSDAGADKRVIEAFEQRFEDLAGGEHDPDQDKVRQRQRAKPDESPSFWSHQGNGLAVLAGPETLRTFRLAEAPKPLAEVADRFHLTPLLRAMTSRHDAFVLALAEESVRLIHVFAHLPPSRVGVPGLPKNAEEATQRPSFHVRAPRGHLQNLEGEKVLLHRYVEKVDHAVRDTLRGHATPLILAATEPLASMFRAICDYPELAVEVISGNPDRSTDPELENQAIPILDRSTARENKGLDRAV
ncbi:baeRF11 domain-containing protein [Bradyrhizobium sp. USDA 4471]